MGWKGGHGSIIARGRRGAEPGIRRPIAVRFTVDVRLSFVRGALSRTAPASVRIVAMTWGGRGEERSRHRPVRRSGRLHGRGRADGPRGGQDARRRALPVPRGGCHELRRSGRQDPGRRHRRAVRRACRPRGRRRARRAGIVAYATIDRRAGGGPRSAHPHAHRHQHRRGPGRRAARRRRLHGDGRRREHGLTPADRGTPRRCARRAGHARCHRRGRIAYESVGEVEVRGREEKVAAWLAIEPITLPGRRRPARPRPVRRPRAGALPAGRHRAHRHSQRRPSSP